jgi:NMD protein affecting ribosome stability and mRNA decay
VQLESGDDHWQRSLEAASKAREQAMIVERESQATHAKLLAAQEATRNFEKARREHMAIQVCHRQHCCVRCRPVLQQMCATIVHVCADGMILAQHSKQPMLSVCFMVICTGAPGDPGPGE